MFLNWSVDCCWWPGFWARSPSRSTWARPSTRRRYDDILFSFQYHFSQNICMVKELDNTHLFLFQGAKIPKKVCVKTEICKCTKAGFHLTSQSFVKTKICEFDVLIKKSWLSLDFTKRKFSLIWAEFFFVGIFFYPCANCIFVDPRLDRSWTFCWRPPSSPSRPLPPAACQSRTSSGKVWVTRYWHTPVRNAHVRYLCFLQCWGVQICDIVLGFRIRGSSPLANGSGSDSGSCHFRHWPSRSQQKSIFYKFFWLLLFEGTFTSFFKHKKS